MAAPIFCTTPARAGRTEHATKSGTSRLGQLAQGTGHPRQMMAHDDTAWQLCDNDAGAQLRASHCRTAAAGNVRHRLILG